MCLPFLFFFSSNVKATDARLKHINSKSANLKNSKQFRLKELLLVRIQYAAWL